MAMVTLCAVVGALRVVPDRSQFFQYDSVSLSCGQQGNSSEWRVKRNTSLNSNQDCSRSGEGRNDSHCVIDDLYPFDSGAYWCESAAGKCSDTVSIYVTAGSVILESPVLPVVEGDPVTLRCRNNNSSSFSSSSNLTANFYKDSLLIRRSPTGEMTIHSVSKSDEGLYKCDVLDGEESPVSRLDVRGRPEPPDSPLVCTLLPVLGVVLVLAVLLLCLWWRIKGKCDPDVSYTDVIIVQEGEPNRSEDVAPALIFYSRVNLGNT